jgi:hypothetical protein
MEAGAAKPNKRAERREIEKRFLSALLADFGYEFYDLKKEMEKYPVSWRSFNDKRHQVLWRAFERLYPSLSKTYEERLDILEEEAGADLEKMKEGAAPLAWLERELLLAGALSHAGGRKYLYELKTAWPASFDLDSLAGKLKFT